jgi:hypothetical protein
MNVQAGYSSVGVGRSVSVLSTHAFTPFDFFSITNPGSYRLKYQLVIIRSAGMTNNVGPGIPPTLSLPPVEVEFEVKKEEGDKWAIAPMKVKGAELQEK